MQPMLSNVSDVPRNEPRDLQSRLYREIGISAVAAALQISEMAPPSSGDARKRIVRRAA